MTRILCIVLGLFLFVGCSESEQRDSDSGREDENPYYVKTVPGAEVRDIVKAELYEFHAKQDHKKAQQAKVAEITAEIKRREDLVTEEKPYEYFIPLRFNEYGNSHLVNGQPLRFPEIIHANVNYEHGTNNWWGDVIICDFEHYIEEPDIWYSEPEKNVRTKTAQRAYEIMLKLINTHRCSLWLDLRTAELNYDNEIQLGGTVYISYGRSGDRKPLKDYLYDNYRSAVSPDYAEKMTLEKYFD